jgi:hypothetical protein
VEGGDQTKASARERRRSEAGGRRPTIGTGTRQRGREDRGGSVGAVGGITSGLGIGRIVEATKDP